MFPPAPWSMRGQLWLSLFRVPPAVDGARGSRVHAAAFVRYEPGSTLSYSELLVARPVSTAEDGRRVSISDIWVDSPASRAGGRELWAIPKRLCDFAFESVHRGPVTRTEWSASVARRPVARASFTDVSRAGVRLPFTGGTWQPALDGGQRPVTADLRGSSKALPCRGRWEFDRSGPLAWLAAARPLGSFRMADFRMTFG